MHKLFIVSATAAVLVIALSLGASIALLLSQHEDLFPDFMRAMSY
jgi:hypothetical protein